MKELLAKYKAVADDIDTDEKLTTEQRLEMYRTFYRNLIEDIQRRFIDILEGIMENCLIFLCIYTFIKILITSC